MGDDDKDDTGEFSAELIGVSGDVKPEHERQRDVAHALVHELDVLAVNVITLHPDPERGATSSSCISHKVPDHYDGEVTARLAAAMRAAADELEQLYQESVPRSGGSKH